MNLRYATFWMRCSLYHAWLRMRSWKGFLRCERCGRILRLTDEILKALMRRREQ